MPLYQFCFASHIDRVVTCLFTSFALPVILTECEHVYLPVLLCHASDFLQFCQSCGIIEALETEEMDEKRACDSELGKNVVGR